MVLKTTKTPRPKKPRAPRATKSAPANPVAVAAEKALDAPAKAEAAPKAEASDTILGKRDLIDRVVLASGIKKKAAKPVVEAVLKELGDAVSRGDTLNLQPFGKANVKRKKELEHAEIVEVRLRRSKLAIKAAEASAKQEDPVTPLDPLAEAAE